MSMIALEKFEDKKSVAVLSVEWFVGEVSQILEKSDKCRVVVPTGGSPKLFYEILTERYKDFVNWDRVIWITLDELYGISLSHEATFYSYLEVNLFKPLNVKNENIIALDPKAENVENEIERFKPLCMNSDIAILGVGADGHIGMNFPPAKKEQEAHLLELPEDARPAKNLFNDNEVIPSQGITMGVSEILSAGAILLLVDGEKKAGALEQLLHGEVSSNWPVTWLQEHGNVHVFATKDALGE